MKRPKTTDAPLRTEIVRGQLVISIGINTLAFAFDASAHAGVHDDKLGWRRIANVKSPTIFAKDVAIALEHEEEDGSTPLHHLLDNAGKSAMENGSLGIDTEPREIWQ